MFVPFIVGSLAVFLTYLTRHKQNGAGLKMAFAVIFVFLALRYDYGNDYMGYLDNFLAIAGYVTIDIAEFRFEPGWVLLCFMFKSLGFFAMTAFLALFNCVVYYRFIKKYVPASYHWLAVFLYVFDPYLILVHASAMRQSIAISLFLVSIDFLCRKRAILYFLCVGAAASFHRSAFVLLPVYLLAFVNFKINKALASVLFLLFISMFLFGQSVFPYLDQFINAYFPRFAEYRGGTEVQTGLGVIYAAFKLIVILYFAGVEFSQNTNPLETEEDMEFLQPQEEINLLQIDQNAAFLQADARNILFRLAMITFMFIPAGLLIAMFSRINMYFLPVLIVVFPIILFTTKSEFFKLVFLSSLIAFTLFNFWAFFLSPVWRLKFGTYQTIFSAQQWY